MLKSTMLALLLGVSAIATAADKEPAEAQTARTVFVDKGSAKSLVKALNALHAKMEAEGWKYQDMSVYTEDGDLEGIFVTYVRAAPATPAADAKPAN